MARAPARYDLIDDGDNRRAIVQGANWSRGLRVLAQSDLGVISLLDTTGYSARFTVRTDDWDGAVVLALTQAAGITVGYTPAKVLRNTAYAVGQYVIPATGPNGFIYACTVAGTTHLTNEPVFPTTLTQTVSDGTVTWQCRTTDATLANLMIALEPADTAGLADWGFGLYDIELQDTFGHITRLMQGVARLNREVSY